MRQALFRLAAATAAVFLCACACAAELVIGQVAPLKPDDSPGNQLRTGAQVYFDSVNDAGGVHGARLKLVAVDREIGGNDVVVKTRKLIRTEEPIALVALLGTGAMEELVRSGVLNEYGVPVVGMRSGALSLHNPPNPYLFHTRASYAAELDKIVVQAATNGLNRLAVLHEDSAFGRVALGQLKDAMASRPSMSVVGAAAYAANTAQVASAVAAVMRSKPQAVIALASSAATAEFYKSYRAQGGAAPVFALSLVDAMEVTARIGSAAAKGLIVAQVVPDPANNAVPLIKELRRDFGRYARPPMQVTQAVVEGYLAAKVLVEALRRAGPNPGRRKLMAALESMRDFDAGGIAIGFSPRSHAGSKYVDLAIMLGSGRLMR
jgi:ABC-type branched-subunit amino acid transport system substrate-binding protein